MQDEDAGTPSHGLRKRHGRASGGSLVFEDFWTFVEAAYPLTPLEDALERGMKRFTISRSTVQRWYRAGRVFNGESSPGAEDEAFGPLNESLALWDEGVRRHRRLARELGQLGLAPQPLQEIAKASGVRWKSLVKVVARAHSYAIRGDGATGILTYRDLPELSREAALFAVHERRSRVPLPVLLMQEDPWSEDPWSSAFHRVGWYLLKEQVIELLPDSRRSEVITLHVYNTFCMKTGRGRVDRARKTYWGYALGEDLGPGWSLSRKREIDEAVNRQFLADARRAGPVDDKRSNGSDGGIRDPEENVVFGPATYLSVQGRHLTCSVIRGGAVDGRALGAEVPDGTTSGTWKVDLERSTERGIELLTEAKSMRLTSPEVDAEQSH